MGRIPPAHFQVSAYGSVHSQCNLVTYAYVRMYRIKNWIM